MDRELFELVAVPIAVLEADGLTVRWANRSLFEWVPGLELGDSLDAFHAQFVERRAVRAFERGREHCVAAEALDRRGRPRAVEFRRRPVTLDGEPVWLLEGLDQAKAQVMQTLLDTHTRTIEKNNRLLALREHALEEASAKMRRVLDNVHEGLFVIDRQGRVGDARSRACENWFDGPAGTAAAAFIGSFDPKAAAWFELSYEAVTQGLLPYDFCLAQLPTRLERDGTSLELTYVPICDSADELVDVLVVVCDITEALKAARAQQQERDVVELTRRLLRDRAGLEQFTEEVDLMLDRLCKPGVQVEEAMRLLHTVKGNCTLFGANEFSKFCHDVETRVQEEQRVPSSVEAEELKGHWERSMSPIRQMMDSDDRSAIELSDAELNDFIHAIDGASPEQVRSIARSWRNPPVKNMLRLLSEQAVRLAKRLNKDIEVVVRDNDLRLPLKRWRPFWSAVVHVLRNALDHGIEAPDERSARGKSRKGLVTLETRLVRDHVLVQISDDGQGINWAKVEEKYWARVGSDGPRPIRETLVAELLRIGFSTRDEVSEISGRGVGLDAVAAACRRVGGDMDIQSEPDQGTRFLFRFFDSELVEMVRAGQGVLVHGRPRLLGAAESTDVMSLELPRAAHPPA